MAERAAPLVDHVFPGVAVRQWVLSFPHRIRYLLAWDRALCRAVVGVTMRAILGSVRARAGAAGVPRGLGGGIAILRPLGHAPRARLWRDAADIVCRRPAADVVYRRSLA